MSRDFSVYLHTDNLPSPSRWKEEIVQQGFPCELDDDIDLLTFSGFLPCPVNGEISGFEYYASNIDDDVLSELNAALPVNYSITFCAGNHSAEIVAAMAAACCLAKLSCGYLVDFNSGKRLSSTTAIDWVKFQPEMKGK